MVLLKKEASRGLSGDGCSKKAYRLSNRGSSLPSFSLISPTSHVSNSHAIFEYLNREEVSDAGVMQLNCKKRLQLFHQFFVCIS